MAADFPGDAELDALALQVDEQLNALQARPDVTFRGLKSPFGGPEALPDAPDQRTLIEKATGQPFETFWQKYLRHLRKDLCLPGGMLYEQWHKWKDLESKSTVKVGYAVLVGMGIPTASLGPVAVAATVFLLNVALKVGIDTVCEGCQQEGEDPDGSAETKSDEEAKGA
jgi:hypothetical protein